MPFQSHTQTFLLSLVNTHAISLWSLSQPCKSCKSPFDLVDIPVHLRLRLCSKLWTLWSRQSCSTGLLTLLTRNVEIPKKAGWYVLNLKSDQNYRLCLPCRTTRTSTPKTSGPWFADYVVAAEVVVAITSILLHLHQYYLRFQVTWSWRFFRSPSESPRSAGAPVAHHPAPKRSNKTSSNSNDNEKNRVNAMAMGGAVDMNFLTWNTNNLVDPSPSL